MSAFSSWPPTPPGASGGSSASLDTTGAPVDVSGAAPPVAGQVLTATDATHAAWRVPGLKYDPAIRFNVNAGGVATIEPGTWGFVYTYPVSATDITIFVVSSLAAPPVDSRFGLYVSPSVAVPVSVELIGASQIMGLDGTLSTSIVLPPGAMYEWVFYHEDGAAIWGLVSSTLPSESNRPWLSFSPASSPLNGQWVVAPNDVVTLPDATAAAMHCAVLVDKDDPGVSITCATSAFQIGRTLYNAGSEVPVRPGGWYEWVTVDAGEDFRWLPVASGDDAKAPLEQTPASVAADPPPNQWILSSDAGGVAHTPNLPAPGDSVAIFVNTPTATIVPQTGQIMYPPDGGTPVTGPTSLTLQGPNYYEWIWASGQWFPRQNVLSPSLAAAQKQPVRFVCPSNDTLSGLAARDGVTPVAGDRALVAFQTTAKDNGIYIAASGGWSRATDANTSGKVHGGMTVYVNEGTAYADTFFTLTTNDPITLGTTNLAFAVITAGGGASGAVQSVTPVVGASSSFTGDKHWAPIDHKHPFPAPVPATNGFRLSTQSTSPVPADGTFSQVWITPYTGTRIAIYDGSAWQLVEPSTTSYNPTGMTAGIPVDIFAAWSGALNSILVEQVAWTNASTRATGLALQNGVTVKSGTPTRRYLGTILPDSATTFSIATNPAANTKAVCGLWNQDNRILSSFQWTAPTGTATPVSAGSWAPLPSWSTPHVEMVLGQIYNSHVARAVAGVSITTSAQQAAIGLGIDATTSVLGIRGMATGTGAAVTSTLTTHRSVRHANPGLHTVNLLAQVSATGPAFSGNQDLVQSGVIVDIWQ